MAKGFAGTVFLTTDDCQASYEELVARGVEFTEPPEDRPYGIDSGLRDPSGNNSQARGAQRRRLARARARQDQERAARMLDGSPLLRHCSSCSHEDDPPSNMCSAD